MLGAACAGGADALVLRVRGWDAARVARLAEDIVPLARVHGTALLVHQRADIAAAVGADGVHLTSAAPDVRAARAVLRAGQVIGVSCHALADARAAAAAGADYVFLGPVFATPSKAQYGPPLGLDVLRETCASVECAVIGIGGIDATNAAEVRRAGAAGIAAIRAIFEVADVRAATAALRAAVEPVAGGARR